MGKKDILNIITLTMIMGIRMSFYQTDYGIVIFSQVIHTVHAISNAADLKKKLLSMLEGKRYPQLKPSGIDMVRKEKIIQGLFTSKG
ncbi:hypothetical protein SDC9_42951 [bioreactor metagenome]|uniref:Uncharacterized protein n=1 Tax=bioreactor metagenome TaxID=1076179 RepID=A0A644VZA3_9ZZZZ